MISGFTGVRVLLVCGVHRDPSDNTETRKLQEDVLAPLGSLITGSVQHRSARVKHTASNDGI